MIGIRSNSVANIATFIVAMFMFSLSGCGGQSSVRQDVSHSAQQARSLKHATLGVAEIGALRVSLAVRPARGHRIYQDGIWVQADTHGHDAQQVEWHLKLTDRVSHRRIPYINVGISLTGLLGEGGKPLQLVPMWGRGGLTYGAHSRALPDGKHTARITINMPQIAREQNYRDLWQDLVKIEIRFTIKGGQVVRAEGLDNRPLQASTYPRNVRQDEIIAEKSGGTVDVSFIKDRSIILDRSSLAEWQPQEGEVFFKVRLSPYRSPQEALPYTDVSLLTQDGSGQTKEIQLEPVWTTHGLYYGAYLPLQEGDRAHGIKVGVPKLSLEMPRGERYFQSLYDHPQQIKFGQSTAVAKIHHLTIEEARELKFPGRAVSMAGRTKQPDLEHIAILFSRSKNKVSFPDYPVRKYLKKNGMVSSKWVGIGPFKGRSEARKYRAKLKQKRGVTGRIVSVCFDGTNFSRPQNYAQLASFTMRKNVAARTASLARLGYHVISKDVKVGDRDFARMRIGPFKDDVALKRAIVKVKRELGYKTVPVPRCSD